jgi:hypothetical protein
LSSRGIFSGNARAIALATALCLCALSLPANALASASVSGTVTAAGTAVPLAGVQVCAYPVEPEKFFESCDYADSGGEYLLDLASGQYRIEFRGQSLGYVREYFNDKLRWAEADLVTVGVTPVAGIDAALAVGGRIEGEVVTRATGEPASASVYASSVSPEGLGGWTQTDVTGKYVLDGLPPAEYEIEFWPFDDDFLVQYYDRTANWWGAKSVAVTSGGVQSGIDAVLETGGRIEGTIRLAADNSPLEGVRACAESSSGPSGELQCVYSGPDGTYAIEHLPPGVYKVWFAPGQDSGLEVQYWDHKIEWNYADEIEVQGELTTSGIDGYLAPPPPPAPQASLPPIAPLKSSTNRKPRHCKKGFRRKLVKGKRRCVRKHRHRQQRRQKQ